MALHNTQCPHCFTSYVISDEQYRVSEGVVRCGTCRERFQARLDVDKKSIPKFDSEDMYIEPISQDVDSSTIEEAAALSFSEIRALEDSASFSMHSELSVRFSESETINIDIDEKIDTEKILANIQAREERRKNTISAVIEDHENGDSSSQTESVHFNIGEQNLDGGDHDQELISEVDQLIEDRLFNKPEAKDVDVESQELALNPIADAQTRQTSEIESCSDQEPDIIEQDQAADTFTLEAKKQRSGFINWLLAPIFSATCIALVAALIYQLWFRQVMFFDPGSQGDRVVTSVASDINEKIPSKNLALPVRRDLSQLELVSARAKQHPTRPSTMLLDVGLINHAKIAQSMPWLELALYSKEGKLVSRRNLSPDDYSYNNDTSLMMTPREYRRLSIELLSFPKHATGYELKLLSE